MAATLLVTEPGASTPYLAANFDNIQRYALDFYIGHQFQPQARIEAEQLVASSAVISMPLLTGEKIVTWSTKMKREDHLITSNKYA